MDWAAHKAHRDAVVADDGQWVGLLDENGVPLMDMPPVVELDAPETRNNPESLRLTIRVASRSGVVHPVVSELIADGLGRVDAEGALVPLVNPARLVVVERPGPRLAYKVTHAVAAGGPDGPATLEVHAMDVLDLLDALPCWSMPLSVTGTWHRLDRDFAQVWSRPRDMQNLEMAVVADGFSVSGPALQVIHRLIAESMAATYRGVGITSTADMPILAVPPEDGPSPEVLVRPDDSSIWETVSGVAAAAGVRVSARLWLPGDDPVPAAEAVHGPLTAPVVLVFTELAEVV